jgi:thiol:disulfide interchange protein DsbC
MKRKLIGLAIASAMAFSAQASEDLIKKVQTINNGRFATAEIVVLGEVPAPSMKGLFEVSVNGQVLIMDSDAHFGVVGDLYDLTTMTNLTQEKKLSAIKAKAAAVIPTIPKDILISFKSVGEKKATLTVFTDPTCGYCRKLHGEIGELNAAGIEVNYVPYPRQGELDPQGKATAGFEKTRQVTCATDTALAMTEVKGGTDAGKYVKASYDKACEDKVRDGIRFGKSIGFGGTPFLHLDNGDVIPGYQPAASLIQRMVGGK